MDSACASLIAPLAFRSLGASGWPSVIWEEVLVLIGSGIWTACCGKVLGDWGKSVWNVGSCAMDEFVLRRFRRGNYRDRSHRSLQRLKDILNQGTFSKPGCVLRHRFRPGPDIGAVDEKEVPIQGRGRGELEIGSVAMAEDLQLICTDRAPCLLGEERRQNSRTRLARRHLVPVQF